MFSKSIIWSTVVTFLFFYFVPAVFYAATTSCFEEYVLIDIMRTDIMPGILAVGVLLLSFAFVHIFQKWVYFRIVDSPLINYFYWLYTLFNFRCF